MALLGENGAGKTTLMNILYGLYTPDEGEIYIRGKRVEITGPEDVIKFRIGMVHQHFMLVPVFTVTENVMLGIESSGRSTTCRNYQSPLSRSRHSHSRRTNRGAYTAGGR
ncbi:MAG: ATP-binding cassette domain-containing protein [Anaerolineales bacterium]